MRKKRQQDAPESPAADGGPGLAPYPDRQPRQPGQGFDFPLAGGSEHKDGFGQAPLLLVSISRGASFSNVSPDPIKGALHSHHRLVIIVGVSEASAWRAHRPPRIVQDQPLGPPKVVCNSRCSNEEGDVVSFA